MKKIFVFLCGGLLSFSCAFSSAVNHPLAIKNLERFSPEVKVFTSKGDATYRALFHNEVSLTLGDGESIHVTSNGRSISIQGEEYFSYSNRNSKNQYFVSDKLWGNNFLDKVYDISTGVYPKRFLRIRCQVERPGFQLWSRYHGQFHADGAGTFTCGPRLHNTSDIKPLPGEKYDNLNMNIFPSLDEATENLWFRSDKVSYMLGKDDSVTVNHLEKTIEFGKKFEENKLFYEEIIIDGTSLYYPVDEFDVGIFSEKSGDYSDMTVRLRSTNSSERFLRLRCESSKQGSDYFTENVVSNFKRTFTCTTS
jgi:hypothetical protein